jgi:hypothetical protein
VDILNALRTQVKWLKNNEPNSPTALLELAAVEIERLRKELYDRPQHQVIIPTSINETPTIR